MINNRINNNNFLKNSNNKLSSNLLQTYLYNNNFCNKNHHKIPNLSNNFLLKRKVKIYNNKKIFKKWQLNNKISFSHKINNNNKI